MGKLFVNSGQCGTDPNNMTIQRPLNFDMSKNFKLFLEQISYINSVPTIRLNVNDVLLFNFDGVLQKITLASQFYDAITLAATLQAALQVFDPGFLVSYDTVQKYMSLTVPAGHTFQIITSSTSTVPNVVITPLVNTLGWEGLVNRFLSNETVHGKMVELSVQCVHIALNNVNTRTIDTGGGLHQIAQCPMLGGYGDHVYYNWTCTSDSQKILIDGEQLSSLTISLRDRHLCSVGFPQFAHVALIFDLEPYEP